VTLYKALEQDPALTLRLLQSLLMHAPVGVLFLDRELRFLQVNEPLAEINGIPVAAHLGRTVAEIIPSLETALREVTGRILETGQPVLDHEFTGETTSRPGITRWWTESWYPVHDGRGVIVGFVGVVEEITERRNSDVELRLANDRFALAVKASAAVLWQQGLDLRFTWRYDPALSVDSFDAFGKREADFLERAEDVAVIEGLKREVMRRGVSVREEFSPQIQGVIRSFELLMEPLRDAAGRITGLTGAAIDITERKKQEQRRLMLEKQLHESQKMEALGQLAGGVSHDFNNILGTILINVQLARRDAIANWSALVSLEEIEKAARRASDLVQQILAFGRQQPVLRQVISISSAVEESVRLLRAALRGTVRIEYQCDPDTPSVVANRTQIQQIVLNLGNNAAHAMEGRAGQIAIRVESVVLDEAMQPYQKLLPGKYVRLVVSDTGHGMDVATQKRIFEPFFTTKPQGKGTGLGLAVVHGILRAHKAEIVVHSEPGKGSRFEVYFPAVSEVVAAPGSGVTDPAGVAGEDRRQQVLYFGDDQP